MDYKENNEELPLLDDNKLDVHTPEKVEDDYSKVFYCSLKDIEAKAPEWIIEGCVQKGNAINLLLAFENTGKSFVAIDWCLSYVLGATSWHGKKITSVNEDRKTVYLYSEGSPESLMVRINGILQERNKKIEDIDNKFILLNLKEYGLASNGDIKLTKKNTEIIAKALKSRGIEQVDLFVIDTLNGFEEGEENSNTDCANFLNNLICLNNLFEANSLIIHHAGTTSQDKPIEEIRPRGASALSGRVDNTTVIKGNIIKGLEFFNRKCRDTEKKRFFVKGKVIEVVNALPNTFGEYPTTIVLDNIPSEEIEKELIEEREANSQTNVKKISPNVTEFFNLIINGMREEKLKFQKGEKKGEYSFYKKELRRFLIEDCGYRKEKASKDILSDDDRPLGKLISLGMISTNEKERNVKTSEVKCFTHNNILYKHSIGEWEFKTDSEIEKERSKEVMENSNS